MLIRRYAGALVLALPLFLTIAAPVRAHTGAADMAHARATNTAHAGAADTASEAGASAPPDYVALGDSYSAGEGIEPVLDLAPHDAACGRSARAWPRLVRASGAEAPISAAPERFAFRACSGAAISNVLSSPQTTARGEHGVQIDALGAETDIVTVTIGGNDVEFAEVLMHCATTSGCWTSEFLVLSNGRALSLQEWVAVRLRALEDELVPLYEAIRRRTSAQTTVVVASYPRLFAAHSRRTFGCSEFVFFTDTERSGLNAAAMELEQVIRRAAARAGVEFVPMTGVFAGHEVCSQDFPGNEWLVGVDYQWSWPWSPQAVGPASFHPNHLGAQAYSDTMNTVLEAALAGTSPSARPDQAVTDLQAAAAVGPMPQLTDAEIDEAIALELDALDLSSISAMDGTDGCDGTAVPTQQLHLVADGFAPGSTVEVNLQGERQPKISYARVPAGAQGRVTAGVALPEQLDGPTVRVEVIGQAPDGGERRELAVFWAADADSTCGRLAGRTGQLSVDGRPAQAAKQLFRDDHHGPAALPLITPHSS